MDLFVIGDVHGCFYTYLKLLESWNPKTEHLIQLGDLVDRGNYSPMTVRLSHEIQMAFGKQTVFLKGNHEQLMQNYLMGKDTRNTWLSNGGNATLEQFEKCGTDPYQYLNWIKNLPLFWENTDVFVSHAGISVDAVIPLDPNGPDGVLWNRKPLKKLDKLQIIGHTPRADGQAQFFPESNAWNIDTGAYRGICLTGIKIKKNGAFLENISVPTDSKDLEKDNKI
ncbi:metallophosphoesterase family protein [Cecembia sp.]|uniref:metallophosphoesterase family protein n=1 Tax=Cecembia sp. TaxID=1898110 RepID=UPI0025B94CF4|nr:metallophosphoesterase family protein [Cecembia sp.]